MPFESVKQELWMKINKPELWKRWVERYGHHPGLKKYMEQKKQSKARKASAAGVPLPKAVELQIKVVADFFKTEEQAQKFCHKFGVKPEVYLNAVEQVKDKLLEDDVDRILSMMKSKAQALDVDAEKLNYLLIAADRKLSLFFDQFVQKIFGRKLNERLRAKRYYLQH